MRVFLIYPGHSFSTIDVARGYQAAFRRAGHEVAQLNHHHNIGFYRYACDLWAKMNPNYKSTFADILWLAANDVIAKAVELLPLDLVVMVTGLLIHPRAYVGLRKLGVPIALILTESPFSDDIQVDVAEMADIVFTNDKSSVNRLNERNPTFYLPHSWDPARHHPRKVEKAYRHDVYFLGTLYEERERLFKGVDWEGIDASITGTKLEELPDRYQIEGVLSNDEVVKHYCGSKIVLNPHKGPTVQFRPYSLGPRTYEVAACGAFQLVDDSREELAEVFGDILPTFKDSESLCDLIHYFLANDKERKERARRAREAVASCTFDNRLGEIILPSVKEVTGVSSSG